MGETANKQIIIEMKKTAIVVSFVKMRYIIFWESKTEEYDLVGMVGMTSLRS